MPVALEAVDFGVVLPRPLADPHRKVPVGGEADVQALVPAGMGTGGPDDEAGEAGKRDGPTGDQFNGNGFKERADGPTDIAGRQVVAAPGGVGNEALDLLAVLASGLAGLVSAISETGARLGEFVGSDLLEESATFDSSATFR